MEKPTLSTLENLIFQSLSHPIRRKILRTLENRESLSFTELAEEVKVKDTSTLNFHLEKLSLLLMRNGKKYQLSKLGRVALKVENYLRNMILDTYPGLLGECDILVIKTTKVPLIVVLTFIVTLLSSAVLLLSQFLNLNPLLTLLTPSLFILLLNDITYIVKEDCIIVIKRFFSFEHENKIYGRITFYSISRSPLDAVLGTCSVTLHLYNKGVLKTICLKWVRIDERTLRRLEVLTYP